MAEDDADDRVCGLIFLLVALIWFAALAVFGAAVIKLIWWVLFRL